jgi:hypothetical protein
LEFAGDWLGPRRVKIPYSLQLKDRKVVTLHSRDEDWTEYLQMALDVNVKRAAAQSAKMRGLYERILKKIWAERPEIDFEKAIAIAVEIIPGIRLAHRWIVARHAYEEWERTCGVKSMKIPALDGLESLDHVGPQA